MPEMIIEGIAAEVTDPDFGKGGQGQAQRLLHGPTKAPLVAKILPEITINLARTRALIELKLWEHSPCLAAPFAMERTGSDICHLALLAKGNDLLTAGERSLHEHLEIAFLLSCLWTLLENSGIAHGDIAPSNVIIDDTGEAALIDFDNAILSSHNVSASMKGQHMMLAPELRSEDALPNLLSDRFAWAVLFNILLLRRHPADGLTQTPADMDGVMMQGLWPERQRQVTPHEIPIVALGKQLCSLFDRAFAIDPNARPSANDWRKTFHHALTELVIHECPNRYEGVFVPESPIRDCLYCDEALGAIEGQIAGKLKIVLPDTGQKLSVEIESGRTITLGRQNLSGNGRMSRRQLTITPHGSKMLLRHTGRNPSVITMPDGKPYRFDAIWVDTPRDNQTGIELDLAGTLVSLAI